MIGRRFAVALAGVVLLWGLSDRRQSEWWSVLRAALLLAAVINGLVMGATTLARKTRRGLLRVTHSAMLFVAGSTGLLIAASAEASWSDGCNDHGGRLPAGLSAFALIPQPADGVPSSDLATTGLCIRRGENQVAPLGFNTPKPAYRFVKSPVVLMARANPNPSRNAQFTVLMRLDRSLPRRVQGHRSLVELADTSGVPLAVSSRPHCYLTPISEDETYPRSPLRAAKDGTRLDVAIRRNHRILVSRRVPVRLVSGIDDKFAAPFLRQLGCRAG